MRYDKMFTVRLPIEKYAKLEALGNARETSVNSLVRQAITKYLAENPE